MATQLKFKKSTIFIIVQIIIVQIQKCKITNFPQDRLGVPFMEIYLLEQWSDSPNALLSFYYTMNL